jgi:hypothetical protein
MVRPEAGVDVEPLNVIGCLSSGETGENVKRAVVGWGIVDVVVVIVLVLVVVSVIVTVPGPTGGLFSQLMDDATKRETRSGLYMRLFPRRLSMW